MPSPTGKAATPQKQAQVQACALPLLFQPETIEVAWDIAAAAVLLATAATDAEEALPPPLMTLRVMALPATEAAVEVAAAVTAAVEELVPFCAMAMALNMSNDFCAVGLMANTMPLPQCVPIFCLQYIPVIDGLVWGG